MGGPERVGLTSRAGLSRPGCSWRTSEYACWCGASAILSMDIVMQFRNTPAVLQGGYRAYSACAPSPSIPTRQGPTGACCCELTCNGATARRYGNTMGVVPRRTVGPVERTAVMPARTGGVSVAATETCMVDGGGEVAVTPLGDSWFLAR